MGYVVFKGFLSFLTMEFFLFLSSICLSTPGSVGPIPPWVRFDHYPCV